MSDLIPAAPGWRACVWSREQGSAIALPVVAWQHRSGSSGLTSAGREWLEPFVLSEFGEQVSPLGSRSTADWFVAIIPPDGELADYLETAEQVASAEEEAEQRRERERMKAT